MEKLKVGFVGLGLMGKPMALNIFKKGYPLSVYNRSKEKTKEFKKLGISVYDSPAELSKNCDVVITMVTGPKDVRKVIFGKNGIAQTLKENGVIIDMSTIGPASAKEIGEDLKECKINFIDAPVTGSTDRAQTGELTIFAGGKKAVLDSVRDILLCMGKEVLYMGDLGSGQAIKLVNNLIAGETVVILAEAFLLADSLGITRRKVMESLQNVFAVSPNMKRKMPNFVSYNYPTAFSVANIKKDLKLAKENSPNKKLPLLNISERLYSKGIKEGIGDEDLSAVVKILEN